MSDTHGKQGADGDLPDMSRSWRTEGGPERNWVKGESTSWPAGDRDPSARFYGELTGSEAQAEVGQYLQGRRGLAQLVLAAAQMSWRIHHSYWVQRLADHPTLHVGLLAPDAASIIVEIALGERPANPSDPNDLPGASGMVATSKLVLASLHRPNGAGDVSVDSSADQRVLMHWFAPDRIPDPRVTDWRVQDL